MNESFITSCLILAVMEYLGKNYTTIQVNYSNFYCPCFFFNLKLNIFYFCTSDGYVKVEDLLSLRKEYTEKDVRKSVEYSFIDNLVLKEGPPLMIKPAIRQVRCFMILYTYTREHFLICTHSVQKVTTQSQELKKYLGN